MRTDWWFPETEVEGWATWIKGVKRYTFTVIK